MVRRMLESTELWCGNSANGFGDSGPFKRLAEQRDQVDVVTVKNDPLEDAVDVLSRYRRRDIPTPPANVEIRVLRSEKLYDVQRPAAGAAERPKERRLAFVTEADDDERRDAVARPDMLLPGGEEVEALVGGSECVARLDPPPERLGRRQIAEHLDRNDLANAPHIRGQDHVFSAGMVAYGSVHSDCAALFEPRRPFVRPGRDLGKQLSINSWDILRV